MSTGDLALILVLALVVLLAVYVIADRGVGP